MKHLMLVALLLLSSCTPVRLSVEGPTAQFFFEEPVAEVPVKDGIIVFDQPVNEESVKAFHKTLKDVLNDKPKNVIVRLQSPGGSVFAGFDMARDIEESPVPVICYADQYVASMGSYILEACDVRIMLDNSIAMMHQVATSSSGQLNKHLSTISELIALDHAMAHFIVAKSKMTVEEYEKRTSGGLEFWMSADEALKFGFIDFTARNSTEVKMLAGR